MRLDSLRIRMRAGHPPSGHHLNMIGYGTVTLGETDVLRLGQQVYVIKLNRGLIPQADPRQIALTLLHVGV